MADLTITAVEESEPTAFVSWAHAGYGWSSDQRDAWKSTVLEFTDLLRHHGVRAEVDLYHQHDQAVDWTRFGAKMVGAADFVIVAVSQAWIRRFSGFEVPTVGAGAAREADALLSLYHRNRDEFQRKVKLVYLPGADTDEVPDTLHGVPRFPVSELTVKGAEDLLRTLHGQPLYRPPAVGSRPSLPPYSAATGSTELTAEPAVKSIGFSSIFMDPPQGPVPGWVTEPLLRMRMAGCIAPVTAAEAGPLMPRIRRKIADALDTLALNSFLRSLAARHTPQTALPDRERPQPPAALDCWRLNTDAHMSTAHAMFQLGGDGSSGAVVNLAVNLPAYIHSSEASIRIDVGLSFEESIALFDVARLAMQCLVALPAVRQALTGVLPDSAALSTTGITISAPQNVGATFRENAVDQRMDLSAVGTFSRRLQGDMGVTFRLPNWYGNTHAAAITYLAFERMLTDAGAIDPDEGLALLRHQLQEPTDSD